MRSLWTGMISFGLVNIPINFTLRTTPQRTINYPDPWRNFFQSKIDITQSLKKLENILKKS